MRSDLEYLITINNAYFYQLIPGSLSWFKTTTFYWKQSNTTTYNGPFETLQKAIDSYQSMQAATNRPALITEMPPNLIMINFRTKQRIRF